jgi:hypothetical protein
VQTVLGLQDVPPIANTIHHDLQSRGGTNRREEEKYRHLNKDTNTIFIP